jgi:penicillin-binding protein 1A
LQLRVVEMGAFGDVGGQRYGAYRHWAPEGPQYLQGSVVVMETNSGDVLAMVGGRDFALSEFNRATQAERQTGSSFKPYVYTTAMENGFKPNDLVVDAPVTFGSYTPHNYENDYKGVMTLTNAFAESRNIPAIKLAALVGIRKVIDTVHRFGVTGNIPAYLPVALGAAEITLQDQVDSYSVFPNDGIRVTPRLIRKVENYDGITLWQDRPEINEVISQQTARSMMTLFRAVTSFGTGAAVAQLNHPLGGKTGTTSDFTDAWFLGFSPSVTCGVWVGYDSRESLGEKETGARAALPIWITFMRAAIAGKDDEQFMADQDNTMDRAAAATPAQPGIATAAAPQPARPAYAPSHFFPATGTGTVTRAHTVGSTASPAPRP